MSFPEDAFAYYIEDLQTEGSEELARFLMDRIHLMSESQLLTFYTVVRGRADLLYGQPGFRFWVNLSHTIERYIQYTTGQNPLDW